MSRRAGGRALAVGALIAGVVLAFLVDLALFAFDDSCPQWEDEGTMAAPGSPYSRVMCGPGAEPPLTWAWYAGIVVATLAVLPLLLPRRQPHGVGGRRREWLLIVVALLAPTLLIVLLHLTLPRDCLSGRTTVGECGRDRELR